MKTTLIKILIAILLKLFKEYKADMIKLFMKHVEKHKESNSTFKEIIDYLQKAIEEVV